MNRMCALSYGIPKALRAFLSMSSVLALLLSRVRAQCGLKQAHIACQGYSERKRWERFRDQGKQVRTLSSLFEKSPQIFGRRRTILLLECSRMRIIQVETKAPFARGFLLSVDLCPTSAGIFVPLPQRIRHLLFLALGLKEYG